MIGCPVCSNKLSVSRLKCNSCGLAMDSNFSFPRLARLPHEYMDLAEKMILCGGNMKDLAVEIGISHPTLRRRIDSLIAELKRLKEEDEKNITSILEDIDKGKIPPEEGIRKIKEVQGEI
ncbi:MAG: DUF2089 family protein [Rickettsiales bacterium]